VADARLFTDGQRFKSVTLPGDGEPGWLVGANGCTSIEAVIEGDGRFSFPWFLVYINDKPKFKVSALHVVGLEYLDS
jgi:hypothetical protein